MPWPLPARRADRRGVQGKALAGLDAMAGAWRAAPDWRGRSRRALGELAAAAWRLAEATTRRPSPVSTPWPGWSGVLAAGARLAARLGELA